MAPRAGHGKSRRWIAGGAVALALLVVPAAAVAATGSGRAHAAAKTATSILHTNVPAKGKYLLIVYVRSRGKHSRQVDVYVPGQPMRSVVANPWWGAAVYYRLNLSATGLVVRTVNAPPAVKVRASLKLRRSSSKPSSTSSSSNGSPPGPTSTTTTTVTPTTTTPTTPTSPAPPYPLVPAAPYKLSWQDNFAQDFAGGSTTPNPNNWSMDSWGGCGVGTMSQNNTPTGNVDGVSATQNAYLTPQGLAITAVRAANGAYASAQLDSVGHFSGLYGQVEATIYLPTAQGLCPGFWMLGDNNIPGSSPAVPGEIDIVEAPTFGTGPGAPASASYFDLHGTSNGSTTQAWQSSAPMLAAGFHTYAIIWRPDAIIWTIDGQEVADATPPALVAGASWSNYTYGNFHLILDLAVGGWPCDFSQCGPQAASVGQSYTMYVQSVKWYQEPQP
jgi:beta-glucanase (GH16 family)